MDNTMAPSPVPEGLRKWARGAYAEEAAVELLLKAFDGRYAQLGQAWIRECESPGWFWLDVERLAEHNADLSIEEQRVLSIVEMLVTGGPLVQICGALQGIGRAQLAAVLGALVHAGGPHEPVGLTISLNNYPEDCSDVLTWPEPPWVSEPHRFETTTAGTGGN